MNSTYRIRWSDNDKYFGPLTYARDRSSRGIAIVLSSGSDDHPGCRLRVTVFGHTAILALPAVVRPWKRKIKAESWDDATVKRIGRDWYWDTHEREYGLSYSAGFLNVSLGRQTYDSSTEQRWSKFLPWANWRHVRRSLYDATGHHFWTEPRRTGLTREAVIDNLNELMAAEERCPSRTFEFEDFDGERLTAKTRIEEREWRFGTGWFSWLSIFAKAKICRSLEIKFSGETGERKRSWKGGTIGHGINIAAGELHELAFRRYCAEHQMKFIRPN